MYVCNLICVHDACVLYMLGAIHRNCPELNACLESKYGVIACTAHTHTHRLYTHHIVHTILCIGAFLYLKPCTHKTHTHTCGEAVPCVSRQSGKNQQHAAARAHGGQNMSFIQFTTMPYITQHLCVRAHTEDT